MWINILYFVNVDKPCTYILWTNINTKRCNNYIVNNCFTKKWVNQEYLNAIELLIITFASSIRVLVVILTFCCMKVLGSNISLVSYFHLKLLHTFLLSKFFFSNDVYLICLLIQNFEDAILACMDLTHFRMVMCCHGGISGV